MSTLSDGLEILVVDPIAIDKSQEEKLMEVFKRAIEQLQPTCIERADFWADEFDPSLADADACFHAVLFREKHLQPEAWAVTFTRGQQSLWITANLDTGVTVQN